MSDGVEGERCEVCHSRKSGNVCEECERRNRTESSDADVPLHLRIMPARRAATHATEKIFMASPVGHATRGDRSPVRKVASPTRKAADRGKLLRGGSEGDDEAVAPPPPFPESQEESTKTLSDSFPKNPSDLEPKNSSEKISLHPSDEEDIASTPVAEPSLGEPSEASPVEPLRAKDEPNDGEPTLHSSTTQTTEVEPVRSGRKRPRQPPTKPDGRGRGGRRRSMGRSDAPPPPQAASGAPASSSSDQSDTAIGPSTPPPIPEAADEATFAFERRRATVALESLRAQSASGDSGEPLSSWLQYVRTVGRTVSREFAVHEAEAMRERLGELRGQVREAQGVAQADLQVRTRELVQRYRLEVDDVLCRCRSDLEADFLRRRTGDLADLDVCGRALDRLHAVLCHVKTVQDAAPVDAEALKARQVVPQVEEAMGVLRQDMADFEAYVDAKLAELRSSFFGGLDELRRQWDYRLAVYEESLMAQLGLAMARSSDLLHRAFAGASTAAPDLLWPNRSLLLREPHVLPNLDRQLAGDMLRAVAARDALPDELRTQNDGSLVLDSQALAVERSSNFDLAETHPTRSLALEPEPASANAREVFDPLPSPALADNSLPESAEPPR